MHTFTKLGLVLGLVVPSSVFAAAGDLDVTFGSSGKVTTTIGTTKLGVQPADGKLLVLGTGLDFRIARYYPDGVLDTTFGVSGVVTTDIDSIRYNISGNSVEEAFDIAVQADGKILVAGYYWNQSPPPGQPSTDDIVVVRYNSNGSIDTTFGTNGVAIASVLKSGLAIHDRGYALAVQSNGAIVVTGEYMQDSNVGDFVTVRFTSSGVMDTTFASTGYKITSLSSSQDVARDVAIQADGKIVVVGDKSSTGTISFGVVRYNTNGTADTTFGPSGIRTVNFASSSTNRAYGVAIQSNGKLVVGGQSYTTATNSDFAAARFNTNGTLDSTFDSDGKVTTNFGAAEIAADVMIQADGKIVMVGNAGSGTGLARYNTNGSLDTTFGSGGKVTNTTVSGAVDGLIQADGKILSAGGGSILRFLAQ